MGNVAIEPDTKDWTWVVDVRCPECGLDAASCARAAIGEMIRASATEWQEILASRGSDPRARPSPDTWSALEYACHVRDVLRLFDTRLVLMLTEDAPQYPEWDQDAAAVADRYGEQDPVTVARELRHAADVIAARFDQLSPGQWQRTGSRGDGAHFTVESFARYLLHDDVHHLYDITGVTRDAGRRPA